MSQNIDQRLITGIPGLDEILNGGLIPQRSYLVVGTTGAGKTIFSLQWLLAGVEQGESGMFITTAEPAGQVADNVAGFGWTLNDLTIIDLSLVTPPEQIAQGEYTVFSPAEVEQSSIWQAIIQAVTDHRPHRLVIDSATQLYLLATDPYQFRKQILGLIQFLNRQGCTTLFTLEPASLEEEISIALATDGILRLTRQPGPQRLITLRSLEVEKLRGSDFMSGRHPLRITPNGIVVFPHRIEQADKVQPGQEQLTFGIPGLDELLGGGLESGTTTVLSGPTGIGKSTLALQFLLQAIGQGKRAAFYSFEEPRNSVIVRGRRLGLPVETALADDSLVINQINPLQLYPDEFLAFVRQAVAREGRQALVFDSLRGYQQAMEEFGSLGTHLRNLVTYLNSQGATTLLINEVEQITGDLRLTELGLSFLIDNALLLRYAEVDGRMIRVISCLKKRLGSFQPELRRFQITGQGIQVDNNKLSGLQGLLRGVPVRLEEHA